LLPEKKPVLRDGFVFIETAAVQPGVTFSENPGPLGLNAGPGFHTHSGKNHMTNIIDNKTNACYSENDADGAEAVDVILVAFPMGYLFHGTQFYRVLTSLPALFAEERAPSLFYNVADEFRYRTISKKKSG
jgi:hypothetical protein